MYNPERDDLDFLFQRAMRSNDMSFMVAVHDCLIDAFWNVEADELYKRIYRFMCQFCGTWNQESRFAFLFADSELGQNWYTTSENNI